MDNKLLDTKLRETVAQLEKFAAVGKNPKALNPMIETVRAAQRRLAQFVETGPDKLTTRDEVALRLLPILPGSDMEARMRLAFAQADAFIQISFDSLAVEFMG